MLFFTQKGFAHIFLLVFLILGIIAGYYVVNFTITQLNPKAFYYPDFEITNELGRPLGSKINNPEVYLVIKLPDDWKVENPLTNQKITTPPKGLYPTPSPSGYLSFGDQVVRNITIQNEDEDGAVGGIDPLVVTDNLNDYINKPFKWRLNYLKYGDNDIYRKVTVKIYSEKNPNQDSQYLYREATIILTESIISADTEIPIDVIFDDDTYDFPQAEERVKNMIDDYINSRLQASGVNRRVRFNQAVIQEVKDKCEGISRDTLSSDKSIQLYISNTFGTSHANLGENYICLRQGYMSEEFKKVLLHELGHIFGLPDYYLQNIQVSNNEVASIGICPSVKDSMWRFGNDYFWNVSKEIINSMPNPLPGKTYLWLYYVPKQVNLQIHDDYDTPLGGVKVEVFPAVYQYIEETQKMRLYIPDVTSYESYTDELGTVSLGSAENIFKHFKLPMYSTAESVLIRFTLNNEVRYAALTVSHLNSLYIDDDKTEVATISKSFSGLIPAPKLGEELYVEDFNGDCRDRLNNKEGSELEQHFLIQQKFH